MILPWSHNYKLCKEIAEIILNNKKRVRKLLQSKDLNYRYRQAKNYATAEFSRLGFKVREEECDEVAWTIVMFDLRFYDYDQLLFMEES